MRQWAAVGIDDFTKAYMENVDRAYARIGSFACLTVRVALSVLLLMSAGCRQKDLVYPGSSVVTLTVKFDWREVSGRLPDGMTVVFFPEDEGGKIWRFELPGQEGGVVEVPSGQYRMLAFNNDTRYIYYDDMSLPETYNAFTQEVAVTWPSVVSKEYPELLSLHVYHSPDSLYCGSVEDLSVSLCSASYRMEDSGSMVECGRRIVECRPSPRTCRYTCHFRDVVNIGGFRRGYCVLAGLSPSELMMYDCMSAADGASVFGVSASGDTLSGTTVAFGISDSRSVRQYVYLIAVLADGSLSVMRRDVTDQVLNSPDRRNVIIEVDGLVFPEVNPVDPDRPDAGFDVDVEGWETVIIDKVIS